MKLLALSTALLSLSTTVLSTSKSNLKNVKKNYDVFELFFLFLTNTTTNDILLFD